MISWYFSRFYLWTMLCYCSIYCGPASVFLSQFHGSMFCWNC